MERRNKSTLKKNTPNTTELSTPLKRKRETVAGSAKKAKYAHSVKEEDSQFLQLIPASVFSMGSGDTGQLGLGEDVLEKKRPCQIKGLNDIIIIRAGAMHSICLSKDGKVYTFGCNDECALGRVIVEDEEATVPGLVEFPDGVVIKDITAGDNHSAALTFDGKVFIWGSFRDNNGLIGLLKPFEKVPKPTLVPLDKKIVKISSGEDHFAMLMENGEILTFGCAEQGQLGRVNPNNLVRGGRGGLQPILTPATVRVKHGVKFCDLWAGAFCTVGKSVSGEVYGCGLNNYNQLGSQDELMQLMMSNLSDFNKLGENWKIFSFGQHHTLAMGESTKVFAIGRGEYGSLGQGNNDHLKEVTQVKIDGDNIVSVAACNRTSYALMNDGTVYSWGMGSSYQLGHGDDEDVNVPTKMTGKAINEMKVIDIAPGFQHVLFRAVTRDAVPVIEQSIPEVKESESEKIDNETMDTQDVAQKPMETEMRSLDNEQPNCETDQTAVNEEKSEETNICLNEPKPSTETNADTKQINSEQTIETPNGIQEQNIEKMVVDQNQDY